MMRAVVDTNVLLVANGSHADVSPDCVEICIDRLEALMKNKGPGDVFVRWLLRNNANSRHVEQVALTGPAVDVFDEFPDAALQATIDPPDRKFLATAAAHPNRPTVWQATDSKWLDWWQPLKAAGVSVEFLCPGDVCRFYAKKFPGQARPPLP